MSKIYRIDPYDKIKTMCLKSYYFLYKHILKAVYSVYFAFSSCVVVFYSISMHFIF